MSRRNRFIKRQQLRQKIAEEKAAYLVDARLVQEFLDSHIDLDKIREIDEQTTQPQLYSWDDAIPPEEVQNLLKGLSSRNGR